MIVKLIDAQESHNRQVSLHPCRITKLAFVKIDRFNTSQYCRACVGEPDYLQSLESITGEIRSSVRPMLMGGRLDTTKVVLLKCSVSSKRRSRTPPLRRTSFLTVKCFPSLCSLRRPIISLGHSQLSPIVDTGAQ